MKFMKSGLALLLIFLPACGAGTVYHQKVDLGGGDTADVVGRTGAFGTDGLAIRFKSKAPEDPDILRLYSWKSRQATIQEYNQKCPDPRQLKNIKTRTENIIETSYQDVPNPHKRQDKIAVVGGTNPSTGNLAVPAFIQGASMAGGMVGGAAVLRPSRISAGGGNATATGGAGGIGFGGAGGSASSSSSSAASASSAAAAAAGN
jgi:hypothetical protein